MAVFKIEDFHGVLPRRSPELLASNQAQTATDVKLWSGELRPWNNTLRVDAPSKTGMAAATAPTVFRYSVTAAGDADGTIAAVANTTAVEITTSAAHGLATADRVFITGTGLAIDDATYAITVTAATTFTLDGTTASGTSAAGTWSKQNGFWFHWATDVDVVNGAVGGDAYDRVYYTDGTLPQMTYSSIATSGGGTDYPTVSYDLGVPVPTASITATVNGTAPTDPLDYVSTSYVYTYVTALGEEGPPSAPSTIVSVGPLQWCALAGMSTGPLTGNYNITTKNIYRVNTGSTASEYQFVTSVPLATTSIDDGTCSISAHDGDNAACITATGTWTPRPDAGLGEALATAEWDAPPATLKGITNMANGMMVGFTGKDVYFSVNRAPHAWPVLYRQAVNANVVAVGAIGASVVVATEKNPHLMSGTSPESVSSVELDIDQACVSKRSLVEMGNFVIYASPSGLVAVAPGSAQLVTKDFFTKDEWQALSPESMHAYRYDNRYLCFYDNGTTQAGFIFDPSDANAALVNLSSHAVGGYRDPLTDDLYLVINGLIEKWDGGSTAQTYTWKSKPIESPAPINLGAGQVIAATYPVTFKLYVDGTLKHTEAVADGTGFTLPSGFVGRFFEVLITGTAHVKSVVVATNRRELARA